MFLTLFSWKKLKKIAFKIALGVKTPNIEGKKIKINTLKFIKLVLPLSRRQKIKLVDANLSYYKKC